MTRKRSIDQLAFDFGEAAPAASPASPLVDEIADRLVAHGITDSHYVLSLGGGLRNPECSSRSRLLQWPCSYFGPRDDGPRLSVWHEELLKLPFVQRVAAITGLAPEGMPIGLSITENHLWHHAVDLATDADFRELLRTQHLTLHRMIVGGAIFGLEYHRLSTANARELLTKIGEKEPRGRSRKLLEGNGLGSLSKDRVPCIRERGAKAAWMLIHGLEDGWLKHKGGFLRVTPKGLERRENSHAQAA